MGKFHKKLGFLRYILPSYFIETCISALNEISNYSYFKRMIRIINESGDAKKNKWIINEEENSINFVVNLQPETLLYNDADIKNYEEAVVSNAILNADSILSESQLFGMINYNTERILTDDYYGYGITGTYKMNAINKNDIVYIAVYSAIILAAVITIPILIF